MRSRGWGGACPQEQPFQSPFRLPHSDFHSSSALITCKNVLLFMRVYPEQVKQREKEENAKRSSMDGGIPAGTSCAGIWKPRAI